MDAIIKTIVGPEAAANLTLYVADVNDREALTRIFDALRNLSGGYYFCLL